MKRKSVFLVLVVLGAGVALGALNTEVAVLREIYHKLNGGLPAALAANGGLKVEGVAGGTPVPVSGTLTGGLTDTQLRATPVPVSGTFWQTTQPVSVATMPSTPVTGTFWQTTQPVSATALPLPTGAATETSVAAAATSTAAKVAATTLTTVTKDTWTAIPAGGQSYITIHAQSVTSANTSTVTIYGSPDGGTTEVVMARADILQGAKAVSVAVGTDASPGGVYLNTPVMVVRAGCTHIRIAETARGTDNFVYRIAMAN